MLWAAINICSADIFTWNLALTLLNLTHVIYLAVNVWPPLIPDNLKELYTKLFVPLKVSLLPRRSSRENAQLGSSLFLNLLLFGA